MGELLEGSITGLSARLGLENTNHKLLNIAFLDVLHPSGAIFRLRIHHERESNLLERSLKDQIHTAASREETASALSTFKRNFIQSPLHTQAVRTLSTRFPLLSPSMRLMKKWRDSHLLSDHISDELIELLTIRTFVHPYPWSVPGGVMTGFLRTLTFISKWNWRSAPLIVDLNGEMSSTDIDAINLRFEAWRKIDPAMNRVVMFAASNIDLDGITWTENRPSKVVAARFTSLAKSACALVKEQGLKIQPQGLFAASLDDYDFVVHVNQTFLGDRHGREKTAQPVFKNLQIQEREDKTLVAYNPVRSYLDELRTLYGNNVIFFSNEQEPSVIAGLWNPQTGPRAWKVNLQYSTMPVLQSGDEEPQVSINKSATLHDIARLGGDLVSRFIVKQ
ncbi:U3 small nucleolar RNA-associated protein 22, partial [Lecanoromycetidae sp. Uapishka_2]